MKYLVRVPDAFRRFDAIMKEMQNFENDLFSSPFFGAPRQLWKRSSALPKVNVKDLDDKYIVEAAIPGIKKENIRVSIEDGKLIIESKSKEENIIEDSGKGYVFRELSSRGFKRIIPFPTSIREDKITGKLDDGLLIIEVPKIEVKVKSTEIKII